MLLQTRAQEKKKQNKNLAHQQTHTHEEEKK
jgi:hypothetical protein